MAVKKIKDKDGKDATPYLNPALVLQVYQDIIDDVKPRTIIVMNGGITFAVMATEQAVATQLN